MTLQETLKQTESMTKQDFETLFFHVLRIASTKYNISFAPNKLIPSQNLTQEKDFEKENVIKKEKPVFGIWKNEISISDDFDAPLDDFKDYM